jgi:hypothetical protein
LTPSWPLQLLLVLLLLAMSQLEMSVASQVAGEEVVAGGLRVHVVVVVVVLVVDVRLVSHVPHLPLQAHSTSQP